VLDLFMFAGRSLPASRFLRGAEPSTAYWSGGGTVILVDYLFWDILYYYR